MRLCDGPASVWSCCIRGTPGLTTRKTTQKKTATTRAATRAPWTGECGPTQYKGTGEDGAPVCKTCSNLDCPFGHYRCGHCSFLANKYRCVKRAAPPPVPPGTFVMATNCVGSSKPITTVDACDAAAWSLGYRIASRRVGSNRVPHGCSYNTESTELVVNVHENVNTDPTRRAICDTRAPTPPPTTQPTTTTPACQVSQDTPVFYTRARAALICSM